MTATLTRPAHIDPRRWHAASWHARSTAVAAARRAEADATNAAHEAAERAELAAAIEAAARAANGSPHERAAAAIRLHDLGIPPEDIVTHLDATPGAIETALRRSGRPDLARPFGRLANWKRHDRCQCGQIKQSRSKRCARCAAKIRNLKRNTTERTTP